MKKRDKIRLWKLTCYFVTVILILHAATLLSSCKTDQEFFEKSSSELTADAPDMQSTLDANETQNTATETVKDISNEMQEKNSVLQQEIKLLLESQEKATLTSASADIEKLLNLPFYDIYLDLDFENAQYYGTEKIYYTNLENTTLESIYLRLFPNSGNSYGDGSLEVTLSSGENSLSATHSSDSSVLKITFKEPVVPGQSILINLEFRGKVPVEFSEGGYGFFNKTEDTISLSGWFPILAVYDSQGWNLDPSSNIGDSVYSDMAYFKVDVSADAALKLASTGILVKEGIEENKEKINYSYASGPCRDFVLVAGKDYTSITDSHNGITFNCHYLKNHQAGAQKSLETAIESFEVFEEKFGKYPYSEFDIVELPLKKVQGIEFPQLVLISSTVFGDDNVIVHEAAHQWWYNLVGNDPIDDPWMDESLATYCQVIFLEETRGKQYAQEMLDYFKKTYESKVAAGQDDIVSEKLSYFEPKGSRHYNAIVYLKGALFLDEIRKNTGDDAFFEALKSYYELKKYATAIPRDLLTVFENASGKNMEKLYEEWLYSAKK